MGQGVKNGNTTPTGGRKYFHLVIFLCLLNISSLIVQISGYALKTCRISKDTAQCAKTELSSVPLDIPSTIKGYELSENKISTIKVSDFTNLSVLTKLDLNRNIISKIDSHAFAHLISLKKLNLDDNHLVDLREDLFNGLRNLTDLRISRNCIKSVASSSFKTMTSLKLLNISHNKLQSITKVHLMLQHLPHLQELHIKNNNITTFHSWELTNRSTELKGLDLSQNPITHFSITADVFPKLTMFNLSTPSGKQQILWDIRNKTFFSRVSTLDISGLQMAFDDMKTLLETVNSSLTSLRMNAMKKYLSLLINISCSIPTLSTLQLRRNNFTFISSDLFRLCINVTELDLAENKIKDIHGNAFRSLQNLKILRLNHNRLSSVPAETRNLPNLGELDLSFNKLEELECDDFANQTKLSYLSLHHNSITALQQCVFKDLIQLQTLNLNTNQMSNLNGTFRRYLPKLRELHLYENELTVIEDGDFMGLQSLQTLSLHDNQIKTLENGSFTGLTKVTYILLQKNHITEDGLNIGVFKDTINLQQLDLRENRIKYTNSSALPQGPFSQLSNLKKLYVLSQHRRLKSHLPRNFLKGLTNLLYLSLRDMQLISLHTDMFNYTPKLQTLDISSNDFGDISPDLFSQIQNLKGLYVSETRLQSLDFLIDANLIKLEFLQARKNQYSVISEEIITSLPALTYLDLQYNSFTCSCDNAWFIKWVEHNQTQVVGAYNFECNYPKNLKNTNMLDLDLRSCSINIEYLMFISTTCTILVFMVVSFTYHFLRWQLVYAYYLFLAFLFDTKHRNEQVPNQYDAFISYNAHDEPWVIRELLPKLEGEQGWRLCLHHRDFEPGRAIIDNITGAIYSSRKTICVISRNFLESEWCSTEIQVASFRLFNEQKDVLILIFLEDIPVCQLSPYYQMRKILKRQTYLSWPQAGQHTELFWEKLRQALKTKDDRGDNKLLLTVVDTP